MPAPRTPPVAADVVIELVDRPGRPIVLIERRFPGQEKSGRQVTFSTDLIYDTLRRHQPDFMDEFSAIVAAGSLDEDAVAVPGYIPAEVISGV